MSRLLLVLLLAACGNKAGTPPETAAERPVATRLEPPNRSAQPAAQAETPPGPPGTDTVEQLLAARHAEDAPDRETIDKHGDGKAILGHLAAHASTMQVRARAFELLGSYDADPTLIAAVGDSALHGKLRAAAVLGLGRRPLSLPGREAARAALHEVAGGVDARVAVEALNVLASQAETRTALGSFELPASATEEARQRLEQLRR